MTYIIQIAIVLIPTIATIWVGTILSKQIKSQKSMIQDLRDYINTTSWKDVMDYYEHYKLDKERQIAVDIAMKEFDEWGGKDKIIEGYTELLNYFYAMVRNLSQDHPELVADRILKAIPKNERFFRDILEGGEQQTPDFDNNPQQE